MITAGAMNSQAIRVCRQATRRSRGRAPFEDVGTEHGRSAGSHD